jgi:hypothetical protein
LPDPDEDGQPGERVPGPLQPQCWRRRTAERGRCLDDQEPSQRQQDETAAQGDIDLEQTPPFVLAEVEKPGQQGQANHE